jgi:hypothetical protein
MCTVPPGAPPAWNNTTAIALCRRLLLDVELANIKFTWIKVRGHLEEIGNDLADQQATLGSPHYPHARALNVQPVAD